jgi:hypothetical protein
MSPEDKEFYELEFGKVVQEDKITNFLQPLGLTLLDGYHDFWGRTPWARSDN